VPRRGKRESVGRLADNCDYRRWVAVSRPALEAVVRHDGPLDVLCCLIDGELLAAAQLSARTGRPLKAVNHYVRLLSIFDLVQRTDGPDGGEPLYAASLEGHPAWVRRAVEEHRGV
jgi:hypothetical protein